MADEIAATETEKAPPTASQVLADQLAGFRTRQGLTVLQLAKRCAEIGVPRIDKNVINKIENRARGVSLDEAFILAAALEVAPTSLFAPLDDEDDPPMSVTPTLVVPTHVFRSWVRGVMELDPKKRSRWFWTEVPESEYLALDRDLHDLVQRRDMLRRRERVLRKKLSLYMEELANEEAASAFGLTATPGRANRLDRLQKRVDLVYDDLAEVLTDLDQIEEWIEGRMEDAKRMRGRVPHGLERVLGARIPSSERRVTDRDVGEAKEELSAARERLKRSPDNGMFQEAVHHAENQLAYLERRLREQREDGGDDAG